MVWCTCLGVCRAMWSVRVLTPSCTSSPAICLCRDRGETVRGCGSEGVGDVRVRVRGCGSEGVGMRE